MGNRTSLTLGHYCEFEANNCIPITWLALFAQQDFLTENRDFDGDKFTVSLFSTSRELAIQHVEKALSQVKNNVFIWPFLRPFKILLDELELCPSNEKIELDVTQFRDAGKIFDKRAIQAVSSFVEMLNALNGDKTSDLERLNRLINDLNLGKDFLVSNLSAEEKMFVLIGTYWGNPEQEALYSLEYFNDDYWNARSEN
jgi:hypothetical protein